MKFNLINLVTNKNKKRNRKSRYKKKGFTLIELTVVLAIMALVITVIAPNFSSVKGRAEENVNKQNCAAIERSVEYLMVDDVIKGVSNILISYTGDTLTTNLTGNAKSELESLLVDLQKPNNGVGYEVNISNNKVTASIDKE